MLARCPKCDQRFCVVGSGATACPFCRVAVEVRVQRLVGAPQVAHAGGAGAEPYAPTPARPPLEVPLDLSSGAASPAPTPVGPPPMLGLPRVRTLFSSPAEFFLRLERGRPRLPPWAGVVLLVAGGAVQGASFSGFLPGQVSLHSGAALGATSTLALLLFVLAAYRLVARMLGADPQVVARAKTVVGYGFVPMALAIVPFGGLPVAIGTCAAAHARGLEHHLGLPFGVAQATVFTSWLAFAVGVTLALRRFAG